MVEKLSVCNIVLCVLISDALGFGMLRMFLLYFVGMMPH